MEERKPPQRILVTGGSFVAQTLQLAMLSEMAAKQGITIITAEQAEAQGLVPHDGMPRLDPPRLEMAPRMVAPPDPYFGHPKRHKARTRRRLFRP